MWYLPKWSNCKRIDEVNYRPWSFGNECSFVCRRSIFSKRSFGIGVWWLHSRISQHHSIWCFSKGTKIAIWWACTWKVQPQLNYQVILFIWTGNLIRLIWKNCPVLTALFSLDSANLILGAVHSFPFSVHISEWYEQAHVFEQMQSPLYRVVLCCTALRWIQRKPNRAAIMAAANRWRLNSFSFFSLSFSTFYSACNNEQMPFALLFNIEFQRCSCAKLTDRSIMINHNWLNQHNIS